VTALDAAPAAAARGRGYDLGVVGSGIVGLGAAYAAARRGLRVVVIDRASAPHGATVRNFGHLCIGAQAGIARTYADVSRDLWRALARDAGFWLRASGTVVAARADDELAVLAAAAHDASDLELLDAAAVRDLVAIADPALIGGARIRPDLQTHPREAAAAIVRHLAALGVEFRTRTNATGVRTGRVDTTRGAVSADRIVVAAGHDLDHLLPDLAEAVGVQRCGLDMLRVRMSLPAPLAAPVLTGWSLVRYGRFAALPETAHLRARLHGERPDLAAIDLNQMYTQLPDGTLLIGDSHRRSDDLSPFQPEHAMDAFLDEASVLFGASARPEVIERWLGVYASAPEDFLVREIDERVHVTIVTTGIGMTTGLGLAETVLAPVLGTAPALNLEGAS